MLLPTSPSPRPPEPRESRPAPTFLPFVDYGPDLPERYDGPRTRVLVAHPTLVRATWEQDGRGLRCWRVTARSLEGELLDACEVNPVAEDAWLTVPAAGRGEVELEAVDATGASRRVALVPFETPPDGPAELAAPPDERWVTLSEGGTALPATAPKGGSLPALGSQALEGRSSIALGLPGGPLR